MAERIRREADSSIRRDCLDHGSSLAQSYERYYNEVHTHLSLHKDAPVRTVGHVLSVPILGGYAFDLNRPFDRLISHIVILYQ